jgi:hypothetical protein
MKQFKVLKVEVKGSYAAPAWARGKWQAVSPPDYLSEAEFTVSAFTEGTAERAVLRIVDPLGIVDEIKVTLEGEDGVRRTHHLDEIGEPVED